MANDTPESLPPELAVPSEPVPASEDPSLAALLDPSNPNALTVDPVQDLAAYASMEIPPDNEHGDGVRNAPDRPCAGVKGNGMMTPKIPVKSEDWRDYNYADFNY